MAQRRLTECKYLGCNNLTRNKSGYCNQHESYYRQKQNAAKKAWKIKTGYKQPRSNSKTEKFYSSKEWQTLRLARKAMDDNLCQDCLAKGKIRVGTQVHHIEPILKNWDRRFDIDNLITLCNKCHKARHGKIIHSEEDDE